MSMTGDDSINYGDQMAIVDNKPINNVYYQLKRLPRPQMTFMAKATNDILAKASSTSGCLNDCGKTSNGQTCAC